MQTWIVRTALVAGIVLTAMPALAQDRDQRSKPIEEPAKPAEPSASPATGGDVKPSAVDPAQATKTGANTGEGASYNRSSEKGDSAMPKEEGDKTK